MARRLCVWWTETVMKHWFSYIGCCMWSGNRISNDFWFLYHSKDTRKENGKSTIAAVDVAFTVWHGAKECHVHVNVQSDRHTLIYEARQMWHIEMDQILFIFCVCVPPHSQRNAVERKCQFPAGMGQMNGHIIKFSALCEHFIVQNISTSKSVRATNAFSSLFFAFA